jgi:hypothetical protein
MTYLGGKFPSRGFFYGHLLAVKSSLAREVSIKLANFAKSRQNFRKFKINFPLYTILEQFSNL